MVVREDKRRSGLEGSCHTRINLSEPFGELCDTPSGRLIARQLVSMACGTQPESLEFMAHELTQPHIAEVHQLAILNHAEIGRVCEDSVEAVLWQIHRRC